MHRLTAVVLSLGASAALACVGAPLCIPLAPGDRLLVPENAPAFVAPMRGSTLTVRDTSTDAGVRELQSLDGSVSYGIGFYAPGPIASGQLITLESDEPTCGTFTSQRADVTVIAAAPFPSAFGEVTLGEATGYLRPEGGINADCSPASQVSAAKRSVSVVLPDDTFPWLALLQVRVNGSTPPFGHLARSVTRGSPTLVGELTADCREKREVITVPLELQLVIPGRSEVVVSNSMVEVNCAVAPAVPLSCSSVPGIAIGLLALWLRRRRPGL